VGLFDTDHEEPKSKLRRWSITSVVFVLLVGLWAWYHFRFYPERRAAERFFEAVAAGDLQRAYQLWKPPSTYAYKDFLDDWGPGGYYGALKSYHVESAQAPPRGGSGVIVTIEFSPCQPFPSTPDALNRCAVREVKLWVETKDKSLSFPP